MSLKVRLVGAITLVLAAVLVLGGGLSYWHAQRKVEIEMAAAREVGRNTVDRRLDEIDRAADPAAHLVETVRIFDGDRHLQALLLSADGSEIARSSVPAPANRVPDWFVGLIAPAIPVDRIALPDHGVAFVLAPDPRSEVDEVWADVVVSLSVLTAFFVAAFGFILWIIGRSLEPIDALTVAFGRIGGGDYSTRLRESGSPELAGLCRAYNAMAERLQDLDQRNRQLSEQLARVQDEERADLARDLHDEVGPFLFAIDVDASTIQTEAARLPGSGARLVADRAAAVKMAAAHARTHVRDLLGRLRPGVVGSLGLAAAVDEIASFHRDRHPEVRFVIDIPDASFGPEADTAVLAVIREAITNAVKHAAPCTVEVSAIDIGGEVALSVADDGPGLSRRGGGGYGLIGMRERVEALGGTLTVADRPGGRGVTVSGLIPLRGGARRNGRMAG